MIDHAGWCIGQPCTCAAGNYHEQVLPLELGVTPPSTYDVGRGIADDVLGIQRRAEMFEVVNGRKHRCAECGTLMYVTLKGEWFHRANSETYCPTNTPPIQHNLLTGSVGIEDLDVYEESWE